MLRNAYRKVPQLPCCSKLSPSSNAQCSPAESVAIGNCCKQPSPPQPGEIILQGEKAVEPAQLIKCWDKNSQGSSHDLVCCIFIEGKKVLHALLLNILHELFFFFTEE